MPEKIGANVSVSVEMSIALVMAFPLNGIQCKSNMNASTAHIFCRSELYNSGTLMAGTCFGIPNSTDALISFE